jgi:large subunit ribosomal protein L29
MNFQDLKNKSESELQKTAQELRAEALALRLQKSTGQLENTGRLRVIRRSVAKIETILTKKTSAR